MAQSGHLRADRPPSHHAGRRTCVGCRQRDDRSVLLRVVALAVEGAGESDMVRVLPDPREREPGRGAWLHPRAACLEQAVRRRAFGRALRVRAGLDLSAVHEYIAQQGDR